MTLVCEMLRDVRLSDESPLVQSKLWHRSVASISQLDLLAFLALHKGKDSYRSATRDINVFCDSWIRGFATGRIEDSDAFYFEPPRQVYTVGDLTNWLSTTTHARAAAILFALDSGWPLKDVVGITWRHMHQKLHTLPPLSFEIVDSAVRHLKLDYVFWEFMESGAAAPLFGLEETVLITCEGMGIDQLRVAYADMAMTDSGENAAAVASHFARMEASLGL